MIDFIVDMLTEIGAFFVELWTNKLLGKKRRKDKRQDGEQPPTE